MTKQQKDFVHMYLKHRDKIVAHNLAYGNNPNYDSVESSANRLLRNPEIADTIRSIQDNIRYEVEQEFKAKYREELMTIYEKRLLLKKIATGELYVEQKYKGKNCTQCSQYISPTYHMMMQALKEDSKLAGHYPFKQNGKWVIPALQTGQEEKEDTSPFGRPVRMACPGGGWGGSTREEQAAPDKNININTEKDNIGQQIDFMQNQETSPLQGDLGVDSQNSNTPENDQSEPCNGAGNKRQHPEETNTDNQPLTNSLETSVDPSGNIISQEKLRELLYPQKPKLSYMKNNP